MTTTEEVIRLAREACGEFRLTGAVMFGADELQVFAAKVADLVRAEENEACAKFVETQRNDIPACGFEFAAAIRARRK